MGSGKPWKIRPWLLKATQSAWPSTTPTSTKQNLLLTLESRFKSSQVMIKNAPHHVISLLSFLPRSPTRHHDTTKEQVFKAGMTCSCSHFCLRVRPRPTTKNHTTKHQTLTVLQAKSRTRSTSLLAEARFWKICCKDWYSSGKAVTALERGAM